MSAGLLVCCGSLTLDNVLTADRRILPQTWGGNVLYSAVAARLWHDAVGIVTRAGADYPPEAFGAMERLGIDTAGIVVTDEPHGMNVAFCYSPDGSRVRAFPPEAMEAIPAAERARFVDYTTYGVAHRFKTWEAFSPLGEDLPAHYVEWMVAMHCAAMPVTSHISLAGRVRAERGGEVWLQVDSPWYDERDLSRDAGAPLFGLLDALLPSEIDVTNAAPAGEQARTIDTLLQRGLPHVVLKRGADGSLIHVASGERIAIPSWPADIVDLTGAGDAYCGGFLAGMALTGDPRRAARYGTVSASFAIEGVGISRLMTTSADEATARLADFDRDGPGSGHAIQNRESHPCS